MGGHTASLTLVLYRCLCGGWFSVGWGLRERNGPSVPHCVAVGQALEEARWGVCRRRPRRVCARLPPWVRGHIIHLLMGHTSMRDWLLLEKKLPGLPGPNVPVDTGRSCVLSCTGGQQTGWGGGAGAAPLHPVATLQQPLYSPSPVVPKSKKAKPHGKTPHSHPLLPVLSLCLLPPTPTPLPIFVNKYKTSGLRPATTNRSPVPAARPGWGDLWLPV